MDIRVDAVPAFQDNYIWIIHDTVDAVIVDPGDAAPVVDVLEARALTPRAILLTHHHPDHIGGVEDLLARNPMPVFGPREARMPMVTRVVGQGDRVTLERPAVQLDVLEVPGHTRSHIAFHGHGRLFCGDTLFSVGCGRMFEGTAEQMQASMDRIAALPDDTRIHCAHEYTLANCAFARAVEPTNADLARRAETVAEQRRSGAITLPSRLGDERRCNPFLRTREAAVIHAAKQRDPACDGAPASVFGVLRAWKDRF